MRFAPVGHPAPVRLPGVGSRTTRKGGVVPPSGAYSPCMASTEVAVPRVEGRSRMFAFLEREGLVVGVVSAYAASVAYRLPWRIAQDGWLALLGGRQVLHQGLPGADGLTYWTAGRHWVDQQWIAQAISYSLYSIGGLKLFALTHVALVVLALGLVVAGARRRGASPRAVAWLTIGVCYLLALAAGHVRTQSFAYPLFAVVLLLLLDDVRRPSRRVLLVLPVLVLWANVHGSVVLGGALVALHGGLLVVRRDCPRAVRTGGALLVAGSALALVATPWFVGTLGYYRSTVFNSAFKSILSEWGPPTLSLSLLPLFLLVGLGLWLLGRCQRRLAAFEGLAFVLLVALAFVAQRNIVWLAFGAIPLLAPALEEVLPRPSRPVRAQMNLVVALVAGIFACFVLLGSGLRPESWYLEPWPAGAAAAVARAAKHDPAARVYANEQYADWLLMTHPELAGRIAYDVRFELLSHKQLAALFKWRNQIGAGWAGAAKGARIVVLALPSERANERALLTRPGVLVLYRDSRIAVLLRPRAGS